MDNFATPGTTNAFGLPTSPSNFIEPGKRPMSSTSPSVVLNRRTGDVAMVIGGTGGSRIISGMANVCTDRLSHFIFLITSVQTDVYKLNNNNLRKYVFEGCNSHTLVEQDIN